MNTPGIDHEDSNAALARLIATLALVVALVILIGGAVVTIVSADKYSAAQYFGDLKTVVIGLGVVAVALGFTPVISQRVHRRFNDPDSDS